MTDLTNHVHNILPMNVNVDKHHRNIDIFEQVCAQKPSSTFNDLYSWTATKLGFRKNCIHLSYEIGNIDRSKWIRLAIWTANSYQPAQNIGAHINSCLFFYTFFWPTMRNSKQELRISMKDLLCLTILFNTFASSSSTPKFVMNSSWIPWPKSIINPTQSPLHHLKMLDCAVKSCQNCMYNTSIITHH